jgi:signal transduction histidine kinase/tetratricopeptide (TPR) repeat protein
VYLKLFKYSKLLCLVFLSTSLYGQNSVADSLEQKLKSTTGVERFEVLYALAFEHVPADFDRATECADDAIEVAYTLGDSSKIVKGLLSKGFVLRRRELFDEALLYFYKALSIGQRNSLYKETGYILNSLALIYYSKANYDKALEYHYQCLVLREAHGTQHDIAVTLNNLGVVYMQLSNFEEALKFYTRSLEVKTANNITYDLDLLLINMGLCNHSLGKDGVAREYILRGLKVCDNQCSYYILTLAHFGLGISFRKENIDSAEFHHKLSLKLASELQDKRWQIENRITLSEISLARKSPAQAQIYLDSAEESARETQYNYLLMEVYEDYSKLYIQLADFEKASLYQQKYIQLNDSLLGSKLRNIVNIETNYRERENIQTIAAKEHIIRRQQSLTIAIVIIALLVASLTFVLYRSNKTKKKVNDALSEAKAIIEDQNRQLLNSNIHLDKELKERNVDLEKANESLRKVNDELDNFIYKTSHDIRGPLASLKGMCNVAIMDVTDPVALGYLKKLDITAEKLNTILARLLIVNQINNSAIGTQPIDFDQIVDDVLLLEKKKGIPTRLTIRKNIEAEIEYYSDKEFIRIIFENLIDNAIKFYNNTEWAEPFVLINVQRVEDQVVIKVTDNGIGINQAQPGKIFQMFSRASDRSESGGIGLYITKTAVEKLGGVIDFKMTPERYTEFSVVLPLKTTGVLV